MIWLFYYCCIILVEIINHINLDLENIVTPVKPRVLKQLLEESGFDQHKTEYLVQGFMHGFSLEYHGELVKCKRLAPNLKLRVEANKNYGTKS